MPVYTEDRTGLVTPVSPALESIRQRFGRMATFSVVYTFLLIAFGGIVRITGSGLGCGDDWPLCNGQILPPWDLPTWIEWAHRLLAAGLAIPIVIVAYYAIRYWKEEGFGGRGGASVPAIMAVVLLFIQSALGAITVKLELPPIVTALHFINSMLLVAALILAAVRAGGPTEAPADLQAGRRFARSATAAAVLGLIVISFGALTANVGLEGASTAPSAAAWACQGFPLCNGQIIPDGGGMAHTHWSHRVVAYLLFFHVLGATIAAVRRGAPRLIVRAAKISLGLVIAQIIVAAGLVLMHLPPSFRALHVVVGTAVWLGLAYWTVIARHAMRSRA